MCVAAMVRSRIESSDLAPRSRGCRGLWRVRRHDRDGSPVFVASAGLPGPVWAGARVGHRDAIEETWGRRAARRWMKRAPRASQAFLNESQATTCSRRRAQLRPPSKGSLTPDSTQSSDGVITKPSSKSVAQTIDGLRRVIADRGFTVFNVIDHSGVAERAGVQMPDSKLVMFGKPAVGAAVMLAAPLAARPARTGRGEGRDRRAGNSESSRRLAGVRPCVCGRLRPVPKSVSLRRAIHRCRRGAASQR
jgi:hypothetical protein